MLIFTEYALLKSTYEFRKPDVSSVAPQISVVIPNRWHYLEGKLLSLQIVQKNSERGI